MNEKFRKYLKNLRSIPATSLAVMLILSMCPSIIIAKKMKVLNVYFFKHAGFDEPESKMRIDIFIREVFK